MEIKINIAVESMEDLGKVMDKLEELRKKHNPHCTISANVEVNQNDKSHYQINVGALTPELKEQLPNFINYKN
ncbi:hypothetical protein [Virgibacillus pantothenticus]|uniref:Uncharacterized protein n=1 Tax=Virgibacillus pantothenticus TaxID=1473 RepID=A0A0L0QKJ3_VIRPA|nr:hypothetical protein [Virgibacillus pantothenticus]KNE19076.1 hypothetical protein AFK71_10990 [Virgibacillus pantothenticus]MED3737242.1 hypothetical protein [Virgibacillus pantothenticus]QTY15526.1 hypothetical protein KBP50_16790 [Virgibacillus pantothenticus]SIT00375.1 hypothetical protein SAMN05421787_109173 [Virgibacillus pantothenticus]